MIWFDDYIIIKERLVIWRYKAQHLARYDQSTTWSKRNILKTRAVFAHLSLGEDAEEEHNKMIIIFLLS